MSGCCQDGNRQFPPYLCAHSNICTMLLLLLFSGGLFSEILEKDAALFDRGFNQCQTAVFQDLLTDDFEFYHDRGGPADKATFIRDTQKNICSGTYKVTRIHLQSKVYPMYAGDSLYAALQEGTHAFSENGKVGGYARFSHLWKKEKGTWHLARSYSFSHGPITEHVSQLMQAHRVPVLGIALLENQEVASTALLGSTEERRFNVASLSKVVTAVVALKLVDQGLLSLDDAVYPYWTDPDLKNDPRAKLLTLRNLLSHQSGFPNWRQGKLNFNFTPGTAYGYSGEGMEYVRKVLEVKTERSWEDLTKSLVFSKLGMDSTDWNPKGAVPGYRADGSAYAPLSSVRVNAADDLYTTVGDYARFLSYILKGAGLSPALYKEFLAQQVQTKKGKFFGLGLEAYDLEGSEPVYAHGGSDEGVRCIFFLDPSEGKGLLLLSNSDNGHVLFAPALNIFWPEKGKKIVAAELGE